MPASPKFPRQRHDSSHHANRHTKADNGGLIPVRQRMQVAHPTPCAECPLRKDATPGYLGGYTPEMYIDVLRSPASIACHSSPGFQEGNISTQRHCTGVAAFRANVGHVCMVNGFPTTAHYSTVKIGHDERFFESDESFIAHHKPGQVPEEPEGE